MRLFLTTTSRSILLTAPPEQPSGPSGVGTPRAGIDPAVEDPNVLGATGRTIVRGTHSAIVGQRTAMEAARTGGLRLLYLAARPPTAGCHLRQHLRGFEWREI
jgi:hypothetical protein